MEKIIQLIAELRRAGHDPGQLLQQFSNHIRNMYGACATALVCTENLDTNTCRLLTLYDEHGNKIIENMRLSMQDSHQILLTNKHRNKILSPDRAIVHRGKHYGIHPIFAEYFKQYIDAIILPLYQHTGIYRWLIMLFTKPGKIDSVDIERSLLISTLAINYVASVQDTKKLEAANKWIEQELESVAHLQQLLLPQNTDNLPNVKIAKRFIPHAYVGGDYFDFTLLSRLANSDTNKDNKDWGVMIADASGHGAAAAVEIAMFDAILRTYVANDKASAADVFDYTNKYLFTRLSRGSFITSVIIGYFPEQNILNIANAGHPRPVLIEHKTGNIRILSENIGIPLGILENYHWQNSMVEMYAGDTLILYTDGIIEALSPDNKQFGIERLLSTIKHSPNNPDDLLENIETALQQHCQDMPANDDQTLLIFQPTP